MLLTLNVLKSIPAGRIFHVVITQLQYELPGQMAKFVAVKGAGLNDWAIYFGRGDDATEHVRRHGNKVSTTEFIQHICPCDQEALNLYRR
jgi:hypothetical protein